MSLKSAGERLAMMAAAALSGVSGIPQGVAHSMGVAPTGSLDMRPVRHRYQKVKPITRSNIGKNLFKSGMHAPTGSGMREAARRSRQVLNFQPIKITPRRPGDFEGKAWTKLHQHLEQRAR